MSPRHKYDTLRNMKFSHLFQQRRPLRATSLPPQIKSQLPNSSRETASLYFPQDNLWLIATPQGLYKTKSQILGKANGWHTIQQITWDNSQDLVTIHWADPSQAPILLKNPEKPGLKSFGDYSREFLRKSQLYIHFDQAPSGTKVRISIRAKSDGTRFSEVVAFGPLNSDDQKYVNHLESEVRDAAGMERYPAK